MSLDAATPDNDGTKAIDRIILDALRRYASDNKPQYQIPFPRKFGDSGDVFRKANDLATKVIEDQAGSMNKSLDTLLIFAGLFSSVNSSLFAVSYPMLSSGPSDTTNQLLRQLITGNQTIPTAIPFMMSSKARRDNILFSASLLFSLFAAFGAVLGKQWLVTWSRIPPGVTQKKEASQLQQKITNAEKWKLQFLLEMLLPSMLQISLALFIVGLVDFLWAADSTLGRYSCGLAGSAFLAFLATLILAIIFPSCPFQTPLSHLVMSVPLWAVEALRDFLATYRDASFLLYRAWDRVDDLAINLQDLSDDIDPQLEPLASQTIKFIRQHTDDPFLISAAALNMSALGSRIIVADIATRSWWSLASLAQEQVEILRGKSSMDVDYSETLLMCTGVHRALVHFYLSLDSLSTDSQSLLLKMGYLGTSVQEIRHLDGTELRYSTTMINDLGTTTSLHPFPLPKIYLAAMLKAFLHGLVALRDEIRNPSAKTPERARALASAVAVHLRSPVRGNLTVVAWILYVLYSSQPFGGKKVLDTPDVEITSDPIALADIESQKTLWDLHVGSGQFGQPGRDHPLQLPLLLYSPRFDEYLGRPEDLWRNMLAAITLPEMRAIDNSPKAMSIAQTVAFFLRRVTSDLRNMERRKGEHSVASHLRQLKIQAFEIVQTTLQKALDKDFGTMKDVRKFISSLVDPNTLQFKQGGFPRPHSGMNRFTMALSSLYPSLSVIGASDSLPKEEHAWLLADGSIVGAIVNALALRSNIATETLMLGRIALWVISQKADCWFGEDLDIHRLFINANMARALLEFMRRIAERHSTEFEEIWAADVEPLMQLLFRQEEWLGSFAWSLEEMDLEPANTTDKRSATAPSIYDYTVKTILLIWSKVNDTETFPSPISPLGHQGWFSPDVVGHVVNWPKRITSLDLKTSERSQLVKVYLDVFEGLQSDRGQELLDLKAALTELERMEDGYQRVAEAAAARSTGR